MTFLASVNEVISCQTYLATQDSSSERLNMRIRVCMQAWMDSVKRENESLHEIETKHRLYSKLKHSASTYMSAHTHARTHTHAHTHARTHTRTHAHTHTTYIQFNTFPLNYRSTSHPVGNTNQMEQLMTCEEKHIPHYPAVTAYTPDLFLSVFCCVGGMNCFTVVLM